MNSQAQGVAKHVRSPPQVLSINARIESCELKEVLRSDLFTHRYFAWDESLSAWVIVIEFHPTTLTVRAPDGACVEPTLDGEIPFHFGLQEFTELGEHLLRHPATGLERVLKVIRANNTAYWLVEPAQGVPLSEYLRNHTEPLGERELIRFTHHLLVALAALHREQIYHLAVAPEHIVLTNTDNPVLCGVGLAGYRLAERLGQTDDFLIPVFSAPELGQPGTANALADLYGLGACLYFAITRRLLPMGESGALPAFTQLERNRYSPGLLQIVGKLVHPEPEQRFQSVLEALQALARLTAQEVKRAGTVTERQVSEPSAITEVPRRSGLRTSLMVLVLAVLAGGAYWVFHPQPEPPTVPKTPSASDIAAESGASVEPGAAAPASAPNVVAEAPKPAVLPARRVFQFSDPLHAGGNGPEMVIIPAGAFMMGDARAVGQSSELPVHAVTIAHEFALSRFEVTFDDYDRYAEATKRAKPSDEGWGRGSRPVINVSYNDVIGYVDWLKAQTGKPYRLPSETEWEYAARAGAKGLHSWGDRIGVNRAVCDGCGSQWDFSRTAPVGSFAPNAFGVYDMQGNVAEWVQDCWAPDYSSAPLDGAAQLKGNCGFRVWRGGSWADLPRALRLSARTSYPRDYRSNQAGIRLALDL